MTIQIKLFYCYSLINNKYRNLIYNWTLANNLTINLNKTHYVIFRTPRNKETPTLNIKMGQHILKKHTNTKFLGLQFQENLKWDAHTNDILMKINKCIPIFYNLRNILSYKQLIIIYNGLIFSKINYGIEIYAKSYNLNLEKLQKAQNRLLRIIFKKPQLTSCTSLHFKGGILKLSDNLTLRQQLLIHKAINDPIKMPDIIRKNIIQSNSIHTANTRTKKNIFLTALSYQKKNNKVLDAASIKWNSLDLNIKCISNRPLFKLSISKKCIDGYESV